MKRLLYKYGTRPNEIRRAKRELVLRAALVAGVLLVLAIVMVFSYFRPRLAPAEAAALAAPARAGDPLTNPQLVRLRSEVDALVAQFEARLQEGAADAEALRLLERAIDTQRAVIGARGSEIALRADMDRMEELRSLYDEQMGRFLIAESLSLEQQARALKQAGRDEEALDVLRQARDRQHEVNLQYPRSSARNPARLHQLDNTLVDWKTQPLAERADRLREDAFRLVRERRYAEAKEAMRAALDQQRELNDQHRESRYAGVARLRLFEDAWKTVQVAEEATRVRQLMEAARQALRDEQPALALAHSGEAEGLQRQLMAAFPGLPETRPAILTEIEELRDTSASLPEFQRIRELAERVRRQLRQRDLDRFSATVTEWVRANQNFQRNFPRSQYLAALQREEADYLNENRAEVPALLETLYANLLPVPGYPGTRLYRTEIPQVLYARISGTNPSHHQSPQFPVDSVTWSEAREFARRTGWILARPVSLPARAVFLAALGPVDPQALPEQAWSSQNSERRPRAVGTSAPNGNGFHDLLGNVSEWLDAPAGDAGDRVPAIGGSARDSIQRLATIPEELRIASERNRLVGFRIQVDLNEPADGASN